MKRCPTSARRLHRLNRRQRKKLRLGEFQELIFEVRVAFREPLDEAAYDRFIDGFIDFIESRKLLVGGMGGRLPLAETDGMIAARGRGSPSDEDRRAVLAWLEARPEVVQAEAGEFVDAWHSWDTLEPQS